MFRKNKVCEEFIVEIRPSEMAKKLENSLKYTYVIRWWNFLILLCVFLTATDSLPKRRKITYQTENHLQHFLVDIK